MPFDPITGVHTAYTKEQIAEIEAENEKADALYDRVYALLVENAELIKTPEGVQALQQKMTREEIIEWRHMSELGVEPGTGGGGWTVISVPDDGEDY